MTSDGPRATTKRTKRPDPTKRTKRPGREPLTKDRIVREALRLVDDEGLAALTMRRLSARLGVEAMSLYHHVTNKDALLDAMVIEVYRPFEVVPEPPLNWREWSLRFMRGFRKAALAHPNFFEVLISRPVQTEGLLRVAEVYYRTLVDAGLSLDQAYDAEQTLSSYVLGALTIELMVRRRDPVAEFLEAAQDFTPERFPVLAKVLPLAGRRPDEQFEAGLALVLDGIGARIERTQALVGARAKARAKAGVKTPGPGAHR